MISTRIHGYLDYLMGVVLIIIPFIFNFPEGAATWVPVLLGAGTIIYSLFTDYELGWKKVLSMKTHLGIDLFAGILLAASPWLFGFAEEMYLPHLILGIIEIGAALLTEKKTHYVETKAH